MQVSAEIRWFWRDVAPPGLADWFHAADRHTGAAGGGRERLDEYLADAGRTELGIKRRAVDDPQARGLVEVKGLVVAAFAELRAAPFVGAVQLWSKWTSGALTLPPVLLPLRKRRWLRKLGGAPDSQEVALDANERPLSGRAMPTRGCNVELTCVTTPAGQTWWTFAFEAFGTLQSLPGDLAAAAAAMAVRQPPPLGDGFEASYPAWIAARVLP